MQLFIDVWHVGLFKLVIIKTVWNEYMISIKYSKFIVITGIDKINVIVTWILDCPGYKTTPCDSLHFSEK